MNNISEVLCDFWLLKQIAGFRLQTTSKEKHERTILQLKYWK